LKRWLITTGADEDLDSLRETVAEQGGVLAESPPIPLDPGEQVVEAEGPDDLPEKLESHPAIRKVSPDSSIDFFGSGDV
jgi:hypothetical protein